MSSWRKYIYRYQTVSWLLMMALVVQLSFQLHFHLHHTEVPISQEHEHVMDSHALIDGHTDDLPTTNGNIHELNTSPEGIVKSNLDHSPSFIVFVLIFTLFPTALIVINRQWSLHQNYFHYKSYYGLVPPLRAPPV